MRKLLCVSVVKLWGRCVALAMLQQRCCWGIGFLMGWVMWWVELEAGSLPSPFPSPACPALSFWNLLSSNTPDCTFHVQQVFQPQELTFPSSGTDLCDTNRLISIFTQSLPLCSSGLSSRPAPAQSLLYHQKGLSRWISIPRALPFSSLKHRCSLMPAFFSTMCLCFLFVLVNTEPLHYFCV